VSKAQKIERFRLSLATRLSLLGRIAAKADQPGLVRVQRQSEREDGEVLFHPDEAVVTAIKSLFERFAETGSARRVWLWFRTEGVKFPLQMHEHAEIRWVEASYHAIHRVLTNPVHAAAYVYGKTRAETTLDASGARKTRMRHLPREQWQVLIKEHHQGYIDWSTYEADQPSSGVEQGQAHGPEAAAADPALRLMRCGRATCGWRVAVVHGQSPWLRDFQLASSTSNPLNSCQLSNWICVVWLPAPDDPQQNKSDQEFTRTWAAAVA
jgi:Recombinase